MKRTLITLLKLPLLAVLFTLGVGSMAYARDNWNHDHRGGKHHNRGYVWEHGHHKNKVVLIKERHYYPQFHHYDRHLMQRHYLPHRIVNYYPIFDNYNQVQVNCRLNYSILGTVIGGVTGGLISNQFGGGSGKFYTTAGGVILGSIIGHNLTKADRGCATQVLEYAAPGTQVSWRNPDNGYAYTVLPMNSYRDNTTGSYCREYNSVAYIGGQPQETYGTACRQPDGTWQVVSAY